MKSKIVAISAAALLSLAVLTGCSSSTPGETATPEQGLGDTGTGYVQLPDGRQVLCVWMTGYYKGGPSCDWANAQ